MNSAIPAAAGDGAQFSVKVASRANHLILAFGVLVLIVLALFPLFGGLGWTSRLVDVFTLLALAQLWNLMLGYGGILSIGQQGFIGMGSYALWFFSDILHIHPFIGVALAAFGGAIIALPTAALVFKLRGGYLAIGTWVIAEILRLIVSNIKSAGSGSGLSVQATTQLANETRVAGVYWWALATAVICIVVVYLFLRSRSGLALKAIRDDDLAAKGNGVNLWRMKLYTFLIGGAGSAVVGAIVAIHLLRIQPAAAFSIGWMASLMFIVIIGGIATIEGPIIGTIIYFVIRETASQYGGWYFILLGMVAIIVVIGSPTGIYGYIVKKTNFYLFPLHRKLVYRTESEAADITVDSRENVG